MVGKHKFDICLQIANHLVQRGVPAGAVDSQGATPLHYAACNHNLAFCRFLWGMDDYLKLKKYLLFTMFRQYCRISTLLTVANRC